MVIRHPFCRVAMAFLYVLLYVNTAFAEELSLNQATELALKNNPTIAAGRFTADATLQAARGAKALANPEFFVAPSVIGDAGSDSAVLFSQPLEINGARRVRGQIASFEAIAESNNAVVTMRDVILKVKQVYWDVAKAQQLVKLNEENIVYLDSLNRAVQKQVDVGTIPGAQLVKTQVELARARQELTQAQLELSNSKSALATLMNCPAKSDFVASDKLEFSEAAIDKSKLLAQFASKRPEVAAAMAVQRAAQGQIKAAKLKRVPDIAIQARRESFDNESDGGVAIAVNLPILDWGSLRGERRQAESMACGKQKELEAVRNSVALEVEQAAQSLESSASIVRQYMGGIVAESEQLAAMAQKGFEKGATSYLEVLEAQRTLRSVRIEYASALADYSKSLAQLEWASGSQIACTEVKK